MDGQAHGNTSGRLLGRPSVRTRSPAFHSWASCGYDGSVLPPVRPDDLVRTVSRDGLALLRGHEVNERALLALARDLGEPRPDAQYRPVVRPLRPSEPRHARPNTLSSRHGLGAFPLHTEAAYWKTPPRYLILACVHPGAGARPTHLVDMRVVIGVRPALVDDLRRARWLVDARPPFFANAIAGSGDGAFRFDAACMRPCDGYAETVAHELRETLDTLAPLAMNWRPGDVLAIDNWRFVHGRGTSRVRDPMRVLMRVLVEEKR